MLYYDATEKTMKYSLSLTLFWIIFFVSFIVFTFPLFPINSEALKSNFFFQLGNSPLEIGLSSWDSQWYLYLAQFSYPANPKPGFEQMLYAFLPIYPTLLRIGSLLTQNHILAGIIINLTCMIISSIFLSKFLNRQFSQPESQLAVELWLINPAIIFFIAVYTESIFFCFSILCLYYWITNKHFLSIAFGALCVLTRLQGLLLIIPLSTYTLFGSQSISHLKLSLINSTTIKRLLLITLIPLCFAVYYFFIGNKIHDFHFINTAQMDFGRKPTSITNLATVVRHSLNFTQYPTHNFWYSQLDIIFILVFLILLTFQLIRLPTYLSLYSFGIFLLPLLSGSTMSAIRYFSVSPGFYLLLSYLIKQRPYLEYPIKMVCLSFAILFALLYTHWYWVA